MASGGTPIIRFGIAGMGVGRSRAERAAHAAGAQLSAIFDHRPDNARKLADGWGCQVAASFDELIHRDDVDVVGVFTPSGTHSDLAIQAMRAGKHAIVTKPPDVSVARIDAMRQVAQDTGRLLAVDFDMRYRDSVAR